MRIGLSLAVIVGLCSLGCVEEPNRLEGSIADTFDLRFDSTRLIRYESLDIQLEYLRALEGGGEDIVLKLVFATPEGGIPQGTAFDLDPTRDVAQHIVAAEDDFPALERGKVTFEAGGNEPGPATGELALTFTNGKTLNGAFDTELEDVEF